MKVKVTYDGKEAEFIIKNENEHIQKHWLSGMFYETQRNGLLNVIYARHKDAKLIVDIGASIGNHTIFFSKIMGAEVVAFEPYRPSYDHLEENILLNFDGGKRIELINVALGKESYMGFVEKAEDSQIGMCQVKELGEEENTDNPVRIRPLDDFYDKAVNFDVMKIDVEHYNEKLLKGAERVLTDGKGDVYIEAETEEVLNVTDHYMTKYGYIREPGIVLNHTPTYIYHKA